MKVSRDETIAIELSAQELLDLLGYNEYTAELADTWCEGEDKVKVIGRLDLGSHEGDDEEEEPHDSWSTDIDEREEIEIEDELAERMYNAGLLAKDVGGEYHSTELFERAVRSIVTARAILQDQEPEQEEVPSRGECCKEPSGCGCGTESL